MDRERFDQLLEAYGADYRRWPEAERAAAEGFAAQQGAALGDALAGAHALDTALDAARPVPDTAALAARILAAAPQARRVFDRRAMMALAACAVFGLIVGYGAGMGAPLADADDGYFASAFAAPEPFGDEG